MGTFDNIRNAKEAALFVDQNLPANSEFFTTDWNRLDSLFIAKRHTKLDGITYSQESFRGIPILVGEVKGVQTVIADSSDYADLLVALDRLAFNNSELPYWSDYDIVEGNVSDSYIINNSGFLSPHDNEIKDSLIQKLSKDYPFESVIANWKFAFEIFDNNISAVDANGDLAIGQEEALTISAIQMTLKAPQALMDIALNTMWPKALIFIYNKYDVWLAAQLQQEVDLSKNETIYSLLQKAFTREGEKPFTIAIDYQTTQRQIAAIINTKIRDNVVPSTPNDWELSIGVSRFAVPPLNISVNSNFKVTSLTGGSIRQKNSPKFNTGHSETVVNLTLYFPNHETIWGYNGEGELDIDFDNDSEITIDRFLSSLRGLVTIFKYSPFLPIKNRFLNQTFGMTGVALKGMTVQTLNGFPFVLAVNLTLLKFNHKAYLPMIKDFNQAIHWGKYRQYCGAAAKTIAQTVGKSFLEKEPARVYVDTADVPRFRDTDKTILHDENGYYYLDLTKEGFYPRLDTAFNTLAEFNNGKNFDIYFPKELGADIFAPDASSFRSPQEDSMSDPAVKGLFEGYVSQLGYSTVSDGIQSNLRDQGIINYETMFDFTKSNNKSNNPEFNSIIQFLQNMKYNSTSNMTKKAFDEWSSLRLNDIKNGIGAITGEVLTESQLAEQKSVMELSWMAIVLMGWRQSPYMRTYLRDKSGSANGIAIKEWEIPMSKMDIDWSQVIVNGVSLSMGNNIARLQLEMQEEPVHQHIGGKDTIVNVSMTVIGEDTLIAFKRMFSHISNLAMLSHSRGVLGFLGIKNVITALCGTKYVIPLGFDVETIPNYPHVYNVRLSLVDFDIFQQKRESLDGAQQRQLIDAFGKRNPFLRIKQLWGMFNAYPDFPLSVKDEDGNNVGYLDPDYYFREFQMFDDDIIHWTKEDIPTAMDPNRNPHTDPTQAGKTVPATNAIASDTIDESQDPTQRIQKRGHGTYDDLLSLGFSPEVIVNLGSFDKDQEKTSYVVVGHGGAISLGTRSIEEADSGTGSFNHSVTGMTFKEDLPEGTLNKPVNLGGKVTATYADHQSAYADKGSNPATQFQKMMVDTQYRDRSGSMIRAYPTYMLWLIDEGGSFAGVRLFDNFYGLQSVIDFSVVSSEDILGDTLVLRLSNMYSKLTTQAQKYAAYNPSLDTTDGSQNPTVNAVDNLGNEIDNIFRHMIGDPPIYMQELSHIRLRPGIRLHLRVGYGSNPNSLDTVFNGVITEVQQGDVMTVIAQSDAIELSAYVNTADKKGSSGKIDGGISTGLWLSEPRDLMVRLLSMGSSTFREQTAHATKGAVFSESKFGIRHFGSILYEPMTDNERFKIDARAASAARAMQTASDKNNSDIFYSSTDPKSTLTALKDGASGVVSDFGALPFAAERTGVWGLMQSMWINSFKSRDLELFKRNIYPGNGTGIMQFTAFDTTDTAILWENFRKTAAADSAQQTNIDTLTQSYELKLSAALGRKTARDYDSSFIPPQFSRLTRFDVGRSTNPILVMMGVQTANGDDDIPGYDEVSFRAQTYMRTVWDMFKICADMLPNYIVAVRPFEDRSTVFYGKPHWLYTSGVIPLTTGIPVENKLKFSAENKELKNIIAEIANIGSPGADITGSADYLADAKAITRGSGSDLALGQIGNITQLPLEADNGALIPDEGDNKRRLVDAGIEMHLPTHSGDPTKSNDEHKQTYGMPLNYTYPFYMDRTPGETDHPDKRGGDDTVSKVLWEITIDSTGIPELDLGTESPTQESEAARRRVDHKYYLATNTILKGEVPTDAGKFGAAGDTLSPLEEQWYCNMRWPYAGDHKIDGQTYEMFFPGKRGSNKRMLVANLETGRVCICVPGDWGPNINTGLQMGLSPDTMWYLSGEKEGLSLGRLDNLVIGWVDDKYSPGPVNGKISFGSENESDLARAKFEVSSGAGMTIDQINDMDLTVSLGQSTLATDASIAELFDSADANKIKDYEDLGVLTYIDENGKEQIIDNLEDFAGQNYGNDIGGFINEYGWAFDGINPIGKKDYTGEMIPWTDSTASINRAVVTRDLTTNIGVGAAEVLAIDGSHDPKRIAGAWKSFREGFIDSQAAQDIYTEDVNNLNAIRIWREKNNQEGKVKEFAGYRELAAEFIRYMWVDPYRRSWLGISLDAGKYFDHGYKLSKVMPVWKLYSSSTNAKARNILQSGVRMGGDPATASLSEMDQYMVKHTSSGSDSRNFISQSVNKTKELFGDVGEVFGYVGDLFSAVITGYRMQLAMMGIGLNQAGLMQRQATVLNKILNDSIYYDPVIQNDLVRAADNPFTREYAEPVLEIREPFERLHYINAYQHILGNNISENLTGVKTVMTATSDGKYPVTVYFDKGAPSERQVEGGAETGLFWDNARGAGFFSMLHPIMHPGEFIRGTIKETEGSSDQFISKRIALARLKESLKDIYMGEVIVLGNASIRPHDLVYMSDVYQQMFGMFTVEQVVHHFTPDQGFITSITPNALVTVNDPARWSLTSYMASWMGVKDIRDTVRTKLDLSADASASLNSGYVSLDDLHNSVLDLAKGAFQYTNGNSAIIKDLAAHHGAGLLSPQKATINTGGSDVDLAANQPSDPNGLGRRLGINFGINFTPFAGLAFDAWDWVKERLQDQHGLYIQYLNKNGQPMDAGLSYNQGVAVGQWYSKTVLPGILNVEVRDRSPEGHVRITTDDLLKNLGWQETETRELGRAVSWWANETNASVLNASGFGPDPVYIGKPNVVMAKITSVLDGDTIHFEVLDIDGAPNNTNVKGTDTTSLRFSGINTPEIAYKANHPEYKYTQQNSLGYKAAEYVKYKLLTEPELNGEPNVVAIRVDQASSRDTYGRVLGVIFNSVPVGTPDNKKAETLYKIATQWPINAWDSYFPDGRPYTLNWDLVTKGYANTYLGSIGIGVKKTQEAIDKSKEQ